MMNLFGQAAEGRKPWYRNLEDIKDVVGETVTIDKIIRPVYNYKAGGEN